MSKKTTNLLETIVSFMLALLLVVGVIGLFPNLFDFENWKDSFISSSTEDSSETNEWVSIHYNFIYSDPYTEDAYVDEYGYTVVQFNTAGSKYSIFVPGWSSASKAEIKVDDVEYWIESTPNSGIFDKKITDSNTQRYVGIKLKPKFGQTGFTSEGNPNWDGSNEYIYGFNGDVTCIQDKKDNDCFEFNCSSRITTEGGCQVPIRIRFKGLKVKLTD